MDKTHLNKTHSLRRQEVVPHCLMCGAYISSGEGIVNWNLGFPFLFCSRDCQLDFDSVSANRGVSLRLDRGLYHPHGQVASVIQ